MVRDPSKLSGQKAGKKAAVKVGLATAFRSRLAQLVRASWHSYRRTNCSQMAAGIALFAMLALLPLMMLMVSILPVTLQPVLPAFDVRREILHFAQVTVSPVARSWLQGVLQSFASSTVVVDGLTLLAFVWATLNVFGQLDVSFQRIWLDGDTGQTANWRQMVWEQIRRRRNAFLLLILVLFSFVGTSLIGRWTTEWSATLAGRYSPDQLIITSVVTWLEGSILLALLYRWLLPEKNPLARHLVGGDGGGRR
jgi:uncharacterized BrkB/YihY/UPF0761 family membrane protein